MCFDDHLCNVQFWWKTRIALDANGAIQWNSDSIIESYVPIHMRCSSTCRSACISLCTLCSSLSVREGSIRTIIVTRLPNFFVHAPRSCFAFDKNAFSCNIKLYIFLQAYMRTYIFSISCTGRVIRLNYSPFSHLDAHYYSHMISKRVQRAVESCTSIISVTTNIPQCSVDVPCCGDQQKRTCDFLVTKRLEASFSRAWTWVIRRPSLRASFAQASAPAASS